MLISIFFIAFMIIMAIISIGTSLLRGILNFLFGRRNHQQTYGHTGQTNSSAHQARPKQSAPSGGKKRDKIFDKTEGEYVDFEEIE